MKFIINLLVVGIFLTFFSCDFYPTPKYELISNKIVSEYAKTIAKEKKLLPVATGGSMMTDVKMLAVSFQTNEPLNIEKGRKLLVYCVNQLAKMINENEEIRPFLHDYPFTAKNIEIRIFSNNENFDFECVSSINGTVFYKKTVNNKYMTLKRETFEEAERILAKEESSSNSDFS